MIYRSTTMPYFINMLCKDYANKTALIWKTKYRTKKINYNTLLTYTRKTAFYLLERGLKKQDRVFIIGPNCPQWVTAFFGTVSAGMVLVPVDFNSSPDFISKVIKESKPSLYITSGFLSNKLPSCCNKNNTVFFENFFSEIEKFDDEFLDKKYDFYIGDNDTAEIIFTSGTTDEPKGVVLTHRNIGTNIFNCSLRISIRSGTKLLSILPLSHMFEQIAGLFAPLRQGAQIVYLAGMKPTSIKKALYSEKVNNMVVVPAFLDTFKNLIFLNAEKKGKLEKFKKGLIKAEKIGYFLRRIIFAEIIKKLGGRFDFVISGGSHLDINTEKFWDNLGIKILQGYGLTETSPVITCTDKNKPVLGSVGRVLHSQFIKLADDGEILTAGENVFRGYLNRDKLNKEIFINGWFKTGDIGEIDKDGNLYIKGRKKNIIVNPAGMNIFPEDIEKKLKSYDNINDCIVIAHKGKSFFLNGYILTDEKLKSEQLKNILLDLNSKLAPHQQLKSIVIWHQKDFPRTPTKKIIRREIERILEGKDKSVKEKSDQNKSKSLDDFSVIINLIKEITGIQSSLEVNSRLVEDAGMDSIQKLELITKLEANFLIDLDEEDFYKIVTIGEILPLINKARKNIDLEKKENIISGFRFNIINRIIQSLSFAFFRLFSFLFFRVKAESKNNLYKIYENFIIVANHTSHLDTFSILRALPPYIRRKTFTAAAYDYFFKGHFFSSKVLSYLFNIFPFYRKEMMRKNLNNLGRILDKKHNIILYPEGTRSRDGNMNEFKEGIGMIVKALEVPCLPVKVENAFNLLAYDKKIPKQGRIIVKFGKLMVFPQDMSYGEIAKTLYDRISEL